MHNKAIPLALVIFSLAAAPVIAQGSEQPTTPREQSTTPRGQPTTHKVVKVLIGAGAIAVGATLVAKSGQTTTVTSPLGTSETSTFSTSQLVTGLVIAGTGGFLLWDGLRRHEPPPTTSVGVSVGRGTSGVFLRRAW